MADITPLRVTIPLPGSQFLSAVSENLIQSLGGMNNFLAYFAHEKKDFFLNGTYSLVTVPQTAVDGLAVFEFNAQIIDVWMFNMAAGTSGSTTLDCLVATTPGGSFTSIFTTPPSISYLAGNNCWVGAVNPSLIGPAYVPSPSYVAPTNTTAPVLNATVTNSITAWSAMRVDLTASQSGGQNCGLIVHYRPR